MEQQPPTAPFTLHWVWSHNFWQLAERTPDGSSFIVFYRAPMQQANVILGPEAGVIQPPPLDKPVYMKPAGLRIPLQPEPTIDRRHSESAGGKE
jgi:hypothetical protein